MKLGSIEISYEKKRKAFKESKSQKSHQSLEITEKKHSSLWKKKQLSLDLGNVDKKELRRKSIEQIKIELSKLDVILDESPVTPDKPPELPVITPKTPKNMSLGIESEVK